MTRYLSFRWVIFGIDEKNDRPKRIRRSFLVWRGDALSGVARAEFLFEHAYDAGDGERHHEVDDGDRGPD